MFKLVDIPPGGCHFPVTDAELKVAGTRFTEHRFCGEPAVGPYCAAHRKRCYTGQGKNVEALYQMMKQVEQTISYVGTAIGGEGHGRMSPYNRDTTPDVCEEIKE